MDWLKFVKSSQAKSKINQWFKKVNKEENIIKGKELIDKEAKRKGLVLSELLSPKGMESVLERYAFRDWDSICAAVGHGGLKEGQIINRLKEEMTKNIKKNISVEEVLKKGGELVSQSQAERQGFSREKKSKSGIIVRGIGDIEVRFSRCCTPIPGDEIIGFVTRGRGVSIHRTDCVNIINLDEEERNRLLEAQWSSDAVKEENAAFSAEVLIIGNNRDGMVLDISKAVVEEGISMTSINAKGEKSKARINITVQINNKTQLENFCKKLYTIAGVTDIERVTT